MKKKVAFTIISFAVLKWHECLSFQLPFELRVELPVQFHLELEVNLLVRNVIEGEIEREKVQMKPPNVVDQLNSNASPCLHFPKTNTSYLVWNAKILAPLTWSVP